MIKIEIQDLAKRYNNKLIFEGLSFEKKGGIVGISGPNGSGKSTLLKCLSYLQKPHRGTFSYFRDDQKMSDEGVRTRIGYVAPYVNLYEELTVIENARFINKFTGSDLTEQDLNSLLNNIQLTSLINRPFGKLSTGQQQRAKIAIALIRDPDILFLDEPGSNMDASGIKLINDIVNGLRSEGSLIFIASNDPAELQVCDHMIDLHSLENKIQN